MAKLNTLFNDISVFATNSPITQSMINEHQTDISFGQADFQGLTDVLYKTFVKLYQAIAHNGPGPIIVTLILILVFFLIFIPWVGLVAASLIEAGAALLGAGIKELLDGDEQSMCVQIR